MRKLAICALILLGHTNSVFAAPYIFNATESAAPGDLIFLQGDNFIVSGTNPTVWFHLVTGSEATLVPDVQISSAAIASVTNQAITVNLPTNIPMGLYAVWVMDSGGNSTSSPVLINQARATSFEYGQVSPGYAFRIFGRNLCLPGATPVVNFVNGGNTYPATVVTAYPNDSNVLQVQAPGNLVTSATYTVTVSNGYGSGPGNFDVATAARTIIGRSGGTDPFNLGVPWGPDFAAIAANKLDVTQPPYNADKTGQANALVPIQKALAAAGAAPNGGTVYLPAGTYLINKGNAVTGLYLPANVVLQGAGIGQTIINDASPALNGYSHFITLSGSSPYNSNLSGLTGFTCNQVMPITSGTAGPPDIRNYSAGSSEIFIDHLQVNYAHLLLNSGSTLVCGAFIPQGNNDTNVLVQDCTMSYLRFGNNNYYGYGFTYGSDYIFRGNAFSQFFQRLEFLYMTNLLIEGNHFTRDGAFPPPNYGGAVTCGGIEASGADQKILNNTLDGINLPLSSYNDGESILCQNGPVFSSPGAASAQGTLTSATYNVLVDSSKSWTANQYNGEIAWITSGSGQGEWAQIGGNTATALDLDWKLATVPAAGSQYAIFPANSYLLSTVTGATSNTVADTSQNWPTNFHEGDSIAIVSGQGMGQLRAIAGNTLNTLTVSPAWNEPPGAGSRYSINGALSYGAQRWLVKGNTLHDVVRGIVLYLGAYDCVTVNNTLISAGGIIIDGWQRSLLNSFTYNRFDIGWDNLFADNVVDNPDATASRASYYALHAGLTVTSPLFGTIFLGTESRRNVLQASTPNLHDNAFGSDETFSNIASEQTSGNAYTGVPAILDSVFCDDLAISSSNAFEVTTAGYQTASWNNLLLNCAHSIQNSALAGGTQASLYTTSGSDPCFLRASFSGSGTSTGGAGNLVDNGATATLQAGTGQNSITLSSANPFSASSGSYITISTVTSGTTGIGGCVQLTPTTARTSWGRIFDGRLLSTAISEMWQVNGAFDFFWRPGQTPFADSSMRPIDLTNNSGGNGLELAFHNAADANHLALEVITASNGGGTAVTGSFAPGFAAGQIYHLGVTFATNPAGGATTVNIFAASGTGSIITSGSSAAVPIATGTFALNPGVVTNTGGFLGGGAWTFGDTYANGTVRMNDYDSLQLYSQDPGVFPALGATPLGIATQPVSQTGTIGQPVTLSVTASGSGPFSYQWMENGANLSGATSASLTIPSLTATNTGNYSVVVTDAYGSLPSSTVSVAISTPIPAMPRWALAALVLLLFAVAAAFIRAERRLS